MATQRLRKLLAILMLTLLVIAVTACTRSASTPPPSTEETGPTGAQSETQATMDAVRSAILTQTAQAAAGGIATPTPTEAPEDTPAAVGTPATTGPTATPLAQQLEYTVLPGDWIFKIAREFNVDPQEIIDLNNLTNAASLTPGMVLKIPVSGSVAPTAVVATPGPGTGTPVTGTTVHIVKPGEWIWQIARLYGVDPQAIIDINNLTNPASISPGDELIIP